MNWQDEANCRNMVGVFDNDVPDGLTVAICSGCLVRLECYQWSRRQPRDAEYAIFGGLGRWQRLRIRDKRSTYQSEWQRNLEEFQWMPS